jgi:hypothetical protein
VAGIGKLGIASITRMLYSERMNSTQGTCLGVEYTFTVRAVPSPMAYRARAILLGSTARISGFGNTREAAVQNMQARVQNYAALQAAR